MDTPSERVAQALKDAGLQCHPAPGVLERDWEMWLLHFKPPESYGHCPECGALLDKRCGKFGDFIGCRAYPGCTYTRNL